MVVEQCVMFCKLLSVFNSLKNFPDYYWLNIYLCTGYKPIPYKFDVLYWGDTMKCDGECQKIRELALILSKLMYFRPLWKSQLKYALNAAVIFWGKLADWRTLSSHFNWILRMFAENKSLLQLQRNLQSLKSVWKLISKNKLLCKIKKVSVIYETRFWKPLKENQVQNKNAWKCGKQHFREND